MNFFNAKSFVLATAAFTAFESSAQKTKDHAVGIEFQMRQDEQSLVLRTYENAEKFHEAAQTEIKNLDKKIANSSGAQLEARKARQTRIKAMDRIINGCIMKEWETLEGARSSSAESIDQLIQSFQASLQD